MFATIRIYETPASKHEIASFVEERFIPTVKEISGFRGWYIVDGGDETIASITLFDSLETTLAANEGSERYRRENDDMSKLLPNAPRIVVGEVLRSAMSDSTNH
jgi:hypothetical protein